LTNLSTDTAEIATDLKVDDLRVQRGGRVVLDGLSFRASSGDLFWITGSNGTGKTSILKSLAGLVAVDKGRIEWSHEISDIAYLGHSDGLKGNLSVRENLEFWLAIFQSQVDLEQTMKRLDIWHLRERPAKELSAGQSRRVALARMLLKNAKLWLMDEPAAPMDLDGRHTITDLVATHLSTGGIALIATHTKPYKLGTSSLVLHLGDHPNA